MDQFRLSDKRFGTIAPHLSTDKQGEARFDDRQVFSGIITC